MTRSSVVVALTMGTLGCLAPEGGMSAQRTFPGFNVSYPAPPGWTLRGRDGPMESWTEPRHSSVLMVFVGRYSPLEAAFAEARTVLESMPTQEPEVLEEPALRRVGAVEAMTATVRMRGGNDTTYVIQILARSSQHATTMLVISFALDQRAAAVRAAAEAVVKGMTASAPVVDAAATRDLPGSWVRQESNMSTSGGYVTEEGWDLAADGSFSHWRNHSVSVPNAIIRPEQTRDTGRWQAMGGTLVVTTGEGTTTVGIRREGASVLFVNGTRFIRR